MSTQNVKYADSVAIDRAPHQESSDQNIDKDSQAVGQYTQLSFFFVRIKIFF